MGNRVAPWTLERQIMVGQAVLEARRRRIPWKAIERIYRRDRRHLWRCMRLAKRANETKNLPMRHMRAGAPPPSCGRPEGHAVILTGGSP